MAKVLFFPLAFVFVLGCSQSKNKASDEIKEETLDCPAFVKVGFVKICLPEIDSMVESYNDSIVKVFADKHELKGNTVLSFYLRNPTTVGTNDAGEKTYDDFFKIYQVDNLMNMNIEPTYLDQVANSITTTNTFANWYETQQKLNSELSFLPLDQSYFIDHYSPHPKVRSFVTLYKYKTGGGFETVLIGIMDIVLIKRRLVGLTYYKAYMGAETLIQAKAKNDMIITKLMAANGE